MTVSLLINAMNDAPVVTLASTSTSAVVHGWEDEDILLAGVSVSDVDMVEGWEAEVEVRAILAPTPPRT